MEPTELGLIVNDFLVEHFPRVVSVDFTATMEEDLDKIEEGALGWKEVIREFWSPFSGNLSKAEENAKRVTVPPREIGENCPECGSALIIKRGRFGEFIACSGYPDCTYSRPILKTIGVSCPKCGTGELVRRRSKREGASSTAVLAFPSATSPPGLSPRERSVPNAEEPWSPRGRTSPPSARIVPKGGRI